MQATSSASRAAIPSAAITDLNQVPSPHDESKLATFEGSPFQLYQPYPPAGDQPETIRQFVENIEDGLSYQTLLGVTGSGKAFTIANVTMRVGCPAIVFAPDKTLVTQLYSESRELFPRNAVEYFVSYYDYYQLEVYVPQRDLFIGEGLSINEHVRQVWLSAIKSLLERHDVVIMTTVSAIYGIGNPGEYHQMILTLRAGGKVNQRDVIVRLITMQYIHSETDLQRDTSRVRGDTVNIFPAEHARMAARLELFDDEVESLQLSDPLTSRVRQKILRFTMYPSNHYMTPRETVLHAIKTIKVKLCERLDFFYEENKLMETQQLEQHTCFGLEILQELGFCKDTENYSRHLSGSAPGGPPPTPIDCLPPDAPALLDGSHILIGQLSGMYNGDHACKEALAEYDFRLPSAFGNRPLKFVKFETKMRQVIFVFTTPGDYEKKTTGAEVVEQVVHPTGLVSPTIEVRPATTQIDDLLSEIHVRVEAGECMLMTTLTKHIAEQLTEFLSENGVEVRYLHSDIDTVERVGIVHDLRLRTFDTLVRINLLHEGLDIPEVSLMAILSVNKGGFLCAERSLIQTIGRAAWNVNGTVILYTDRMAGSMKRAIDETEHRRAKQITHNEAHGIAPCGMVKRVKDIIDGVYNVDDARAEPKAAQEAAKYEGMSEKQAPEGTERLEKQMLDHAKNLEFEKAATVRGRLTKLRSQLLGASGEDHIVPTA